MEELSFKDRARREVLTSLPIKDCCKKAFLSAVARTAGSIEISSRRLNLSIWFEDAERALKVTELIKSLYPTDVELTPDRKKQGMTLRIPSGFSKQLILDFELMREESGVWSGFVEGAPQDLLRNECCKISYFKGLFFTCGNVYVPTDGKDGYHFELRLDGDELFADDVMEILSDLRINTKLTLRGENRLVYVKDKDEIFDILTKLGLSDSALRLKGIIDDRETANDVNRAIICETANLDKTMAASAKQLIAIARLIDTGRFDSLSPALKDAARARSEYPECTLSELAEKLGVTKSCLNHRLRKISEIADGAEQ